MPQRDVRRRGDQQSPAQFGAVPIVAGTKQFFGLKEWFGQ
jgi:hypothetical protein